MNRLHLQAGPTGISAAHVCPPAHLRAINLGVPPKRSALHPVHRQTARHDRYESGVLEFYLSATGLEGTDVGRLPAWALEEDAGIFCGEYPLRTSKCEDL